MGCWELKLLKPPSQSQVSRNLKSLLIVENFTRKDVQKIREDVALLANWPGAIDVDRWPEG